MMRARALLLLAALLSTTAANAQPVAAADPLVDGFRDPPASARPRVWWHWLNGNITEDGITKDLEWMHRIGIGGVQTFDATLGTPQIVERRLPYMTRPWKHAFAHAVATADRLGLEFAIAASPGWSETGGPWVAPRDAMKKLVWSETDVLGGTRFRGVLGPPPVTTGPFQDIAFKNDEPGGAPVASPKPSFYTDVAVLAYPIAEGAAPRVTANDAIGTPLDAAALSDASLVSAVDVARGTAAAPGLAILRFAAPRTIRAATVFISDAKSTFSASVLRPIIEAEVDGRWRKLADVPLGVVPTTVSFAPVRTRAVRLVLVPTAVSGPRPMSIGAPGAEIIDIFPKAPQGPTVRLGMFRVSDAARVHRAETKAGFDIALDYYALDAPASPGVDPARVIDLTTRLHPDGTLDWSPPPGRWRIVRLGSTLLGKTNHPATPEATGLEVDKYDAAAVRRYLETYLHLYRDAAGKDAIGKSLGALLTDSIEVGASNWTPDMVSAFKRLRGYDPIPWLPTLTGAVIGSATRSDAFLYDYRQTLADLLADAHYGTLAAVAHEHGLKVYGEALEDKRPVLGDDMAMRAHTDIPMAAMWTYGADGPRATLIGDDRGAASVAHIYGQNLVAAESLTAAFWPWAFAPADLRPMIDLEFANGINRPVIHTSVHQPLDRAPGLSLAMIGQYFTRHETWAELARPWIDYIARTSFLLQQGRNVADLAYFYGEEAPITALNAVTPLADVPPVWGWDYINAPALTDAVTVEHGLIVAKGGARYKALYLGGTSRRMTLPTLRRIAALAEAGATVIGKAPDSSPSLADDPAAFATLVTRLWAGGQETRVGAGRVIAVDSVAQGLARAKIAPDFQHSGPADAELAFVHRRTADADIYWIDNRGNRVAQIDATFSVSGRIPELWHAETGQSEPISWRRFGGSTVTPLTLKAHESVFVVFRKHTALGSETVAPTVETLLATLNAPWSVTFEPGRGAPAKTTMTVLQPLDKSADPGIRYFSGIATYRSGFDLPRASAAKSVVLDLGSVGDVAEVRINGLSVGTLWHPPYRVDIGSAVRAGRNTIEVRVANLWVNRLIGDAQPNAEKVTFTTLPTYRADAPLRTSGLIGPVVLSTRH